MSNRKATRKAAPKAAKRASRPAAKPTPPAAAQAAAPEAVASAPVEVEATQAGVTVEGSKTTRHYDDGTSSTLNHANEDAAKEYAESVKGGK